MNRRKRLSPVLLLFKKLLYIAFEFTATRGHRRYWIHPVNQRRESHGVASYISMVILCMKSASYHRRFLRMTVEKILAKFNKVLLYRILQRLLQILQRILQRRLCTVVCHFLSARACPRAQNQPMRKKRANREVTRPTNDECLVHPNRSLRSIRCLHLTP